MAEAYKNIDEVLAAARTTLQVAEHGYEDFTQGGSESRRTAGLWNTLTWGRSVTIVLQHMRTFGPERFNAWYEPKQAEMRANPTFRYLAELRNQVVKEGSHGGTTGSMFIERATLGELMPQGPEPAGTVGRFVSDNLGGSGWFVQRADGTREKVYAALPLPPGVQARVSAHFASPTMEKGLAPPDAPVDQVLRDYLNYLSGLVEEAVIVFGHK
jgi:hypothetical protein